MIGRVLLAGFAATVGTAAFAQTSPSPPTPFPACPSQEKLQQVRGSQGQYVPDECRRLSITVVRAPNGSEDCVLNFKPGPDPGILDRIAGAAVPTQWWVACENLKLR